VTSRFRIIQKQPEMYALQIKTRWWPFWSDLYLSGSVDWLMEKQREWLHNGEVIAS
jgi:hypothetical protein